MNQDEKEIMTLFFSFLQKMQDTILINRPEYYKLIKSDNYKLNRDPFGRFFLIILYLGSKKRVSMTEFARPLKISPGTATGLIDQLVRKKLVERKANPKDRRKVEVVLTDSGQELYEKAMEVQKNEIKSVLDTLGKEDISHLKRILEKMNKALGIEERKSK